MRAKRRRDRSPGLRRIMQLTVFVFGPASLENERGHQQADTGQIQYTNNSKNSEQHGGEG